MNLSDSMVNEFEKAYRKFRKGKMEPSEFSLHISAAKTTHKMIGQQIQEANLAIQNRKAYRILKQKNIVDETTAIQVEGDKENDKVKCPVQGKLITRAECLDYSGESEHMEECSGCEIGIENKKLLIDETPLYTA